MAQDKNRPKAQDTIDENLKRVYQNTLDEEIPDRFRSLLDQLKAQDASSADQENGGAK